MKLLTLAFLILLSVSIQAGLSYEERERDLTGGSPPAMMESAIETCFAFVGESDMAMDRFQEYWKSEWVPEEGVTYLTPRNNRNLRVYIPGDGQSAKKEEFCHVESDNIGTEAAARMVWRILRFMEKEQPWLHLNSKEGTDDSGCKQWKTSMGVITLTEAGNSGLCQNPSTSGIRITQIPPKTLRAGSNSAKTICRREKSFHQAEARDASGQITVEASIIHVMHCGQSGASRDMLYIYEYLKRPGFRVIRPPHWGSPLGGRDFTSFEEAKAVATAASRPKPE